jgi:hypothetical protein
MIGNRIIVFYKKGNYIKYRIELFAKDLDIYMKNNDVTWIDFDSYSNIAGEKYLNEGEIRNLDDIKHSNNFNNRYYFLKEKIVGDTNGYACMWYVDLDKKEQWEYQYSRFVKRTLSEVSEVSKVSNDDIILIT